MTSVERMRKSRERYKAGIMMLEIPVSEEFVDHLVDAEYLSPMDTENKASIVRAIVRFHADARIALALK
jgi:hypothetical protein